MIKNLLVNWKTSSVGLLMIVGSIIHLVFAMRAGNATEGVWTASVTAIVAGVGSILAGDASQSITKEDAGTTFVRKDQVKPEVIKP